MALVLSRDYPGIVLTIQWYGCLEGVKTVIPNVEDNPEVIRCIVQINLIIMIGKSARLRLNRNSESGYIFKKGIRLNINEERV